MQLHIRYFKGLFCLLLLVSLGFPLVAHAHPVKLQDGAPVFPSSQDIGAVGHSGATIANDASYRIWGSGSDIWEQHDQFHYSWTTLPADGQVVAQVLSQDATDGWAKAGIMLRSSLDDDAANVFLALTPAHGVAFQWRSTAHLQNTSYHAGPDMSSPTWLKLVRQQQTITGFVSADGTTWTQVYSVTAYPCNTCLIGLAVTAHSNQVRSRAVFAHVQLSLGTPPPGPPAFTATRVYGQVGDFTTNTSATNANGYTGPIDGTLDGGGNLYVSDYDNGRVLYYPEGSTTAARVYGQPDFTSGSSGTTATSLNSPYGVALDPWSDLYVADYSNNRVLYYAAGSTTATRVYGQPDFTTGTTNTGGLSATSLDNPYAVAVDASGDLYVGDTGNNRVLYYAAGSTTATRVYGQLNFTTRTTNTGGLSAISLNGPSSVALDSSGNLYVGDTGNNRVLYYPSGSTTATRVYGQAGSFTSADPNHGGLSATCLYSPYGVTLDASGDLYIADEINNRVLYYAAGSTTATRVYGQPDFTTGTTNTGGLSATSLYNPYGVALDASGSLYVTDTGNNRVLMFPHT